MPSTPEQHRVPLECTINGRAVAIEIDPSLRLLDLLRDELGLTGSKEGCGEGECGACTVHIDGDPANSCLVLAIQAHGRRIDTVESIDPASLAPMHELGATQCGACTPGVVMTAQWIQHRPELLQTHTLRELMAGNLCRCTGYNGIIDGLTAQMSTQTTAQARPGDNPCAS